MDRFDPTFNSLTLAFAPGELSTILHHETSRDGPYGMSTVSSRALDTSKPPCRLLDKEDDWNMQGGADTEYQPLEESLTKLQQLVLAWSYCYGNKFQSHNPLGTLSLGSRLSSEPTFVHLNPQSTPDVPSPPILSLPVDQEQVLRCLLIQISLCILRPLWTQ